jgi:hypothetical protein
MIGYQRDLVEHAQVMAEDPRRRFVFTVCPSNPHSINISLILRRAGSSKFYPFSSVIDVCRRISTSIWPDYHYC